MQVQPCEKVCLVLSSVLMVGCATGNRVQMDKNLPLVQSYDLHVYADRDWQRAPFEVEDGEFVRIKASGRWRDIVSVGPEGSRAMSIVAALIPIVNIQTWLCQPKAFAPKGCLVAEFAGGHRVAVGREFSVANPDGYYSGPVHFRCNDDFLGTNSGVLSIAVETYRMPSGPQEDTQTRHASGATGSGQRWAIVIGISDYQYRGKWGLTNLRYAHRDAKAFADYLRTHDAGRFDHVKLLTDSDATTVKLRIALKEEVRAAQENDTVMIFLAGHGAPDPHDRGKLYLITHDTDPEHMAATGLSMKEFQQSLDEIAARQVIVIADACHSAGISDPSKGTRASEQKNQINEGFRGLGGVRRSAAATKSTRLIFTACEANELSAEDTNLNGGHGVFTYHLLEGLKGAADGFGGQKDGRVTLGEMIDYTSDAVKRATQRQQHPDTAGVFDRSLVLGGSR